MAFILLVGALLFHQSLSIPLLIDLTHTIQPNIPFFPSQTRFNFTNRVATWVNGEAPYFYATNTFITGEHMGTHLDAPYHFSTTGWKADEIPLEHLTSIRARIIDVSKQCQKNKNYLITIDDVRRSDLVVPQVHEETGERFLFVLLFYTGWSKYWPDQKTYAGDESHLEFPGLSEQLANYLIETYGTNLVGVGIDTLSLDYGQSKNFPVHQILAKHNKYGLENVAAMDRVRSYVEEDFFALDVFPMKIGNGTGAPCRLLAHLDLTRRNTSNWFGLLVFVFLLFLVALVIKVIYDLIYSSRKDF